VERLGKGSKMIPMIWTRGEYVSRGGFFQWFEIFLAKLSGRIPSHGQLLEEPPVILKTTGAAGCSYRRNKKKKQRDDDADETGEWLAPVLDKIH